MGRQSLPFPHVGWEIKIKNFPFHMREGKLRKIFFLFTRNVRFCLFFIDKNSFFFLAEREIQRNLFPFHMRNGKFQKKIPFPHGGREIEKNLFPFHAKCGVPHFACLPFAVTLTLTMNYFAI